MLIFVIIFAIFGVIGLVMKIVGVAKHEFDLCQYATWFESAASGFIIGLGISMMLGWVHIVSPDDYEKINKLAEKVYVNRCWTILGQEFCGKFHYENDNFKMDCDETGRCDIGLNVKE